MQGAGLRALTHAGQGSCAYALGASVSNPEWCRAAEMGANWRRDFPGGDRKTPNQQPARPGAARLSGGTRKYRRLALIDYSLTNSGCTCAH